MKGEHSSIIKEVDLKKIKELLKDHCLVDERQSLEDQELSLEMNYDRKSRKGGIINKDQDIIISLQQKLEVNFSPKISNLLITNLLQSLYYNEITFEREELVTDHSYIQLTPLLIFTVQLLMKNSILLER